MRAEPDFEVSRYTDAFFFTVHIAAEVLDGPRLHDIPSIQAVCILLEVFDLDLLGERFFAGVDDKRKRVAFRFSALRIFNRHGDEILAGILRCAVERQLAACDKINALHAAVRICGCAAFRIRHDADLALAAVQVYLGVAVQLLPIGVGRLFALICDRTVYRNGTVIVGRGARACAGNAVIIFLADDSGFKGALNLNVELIRIAFAVICNERSLTVRIHDEFQLQIFIAFCDNRDDVAALNGSFAFIGRIALLRNLDVVIIRILSVCAAGGNVIRLFFPRNAIHLKTGNVFHIIARLGEVDMPIVSESIFRKRDLVDIYNFQCGCLELCRNGYVCSRHCEGVGSFGNFFGLHFFAFRLYG